MFQSFFRSLGQVSLRNPVFRSESEGIPSEMGFSAQLSLVDPSSLASGPGSGRGQSFVTGRQQVASGDRLKHANTGVSRSCRTKTIRCFIR